MDADYSMQLDALLVEDSEDDALLLTRQLQGAGYQLTAERVDTRAALIDALARKRWDIVFSDFSMPTFNGMEALALVREHDPDLPVIIVSGTIGEERAVQSMKQGAQDYVIKGNVKRLIPAIEREIKEAKLRREHRVAQERIQRLAYYDHLTQLPNRHRLDEDLGRQREQSSMKALMIVNLVNFNEINAAFGYGKGDELICAAAARLQQAVLNKNADAYHLHGDTFALLTQADTRVAVEAVAQDVIKRLGSHYASSGLRIHMGARIGIVPSFEPGTDASILLQRAHTAVTFAKREGKPFAWYERANDPGAPQRLALLADLHDALSTDQMFLVFQPKIRCDTEKIIGCEALTRWRHPEHGFIPPDTFIEMAEHSGLIDDLTRRVLAHAVRQIETWQKRHVAMPIAINLSARNLLNPQLMDEILDAATRLEDKHSIEIEITETALMSDRDQAMLALHRLDEAGVRIYIDDFGTGFSSLGYLKKLPIHAIKIDKSFVFDLGRDPDSETIVRSTIGLAHNLGLEVVAEGVENRETWEQLKTYGCDEGQGYYFDKPLPAEEFEAKILGAGKRSP